MRINVFVRGVLWTACLSACTVCLASPYCVSGGDWRPGGTMERLGMPPDSYAYQWTYLFDSNTPQMVRPCKSSPCPINGYWAETESIQDPTAFGAWVDNHPGRVWLIANEPNLSSQDGLTPQQYAAMYHTYYEFIAPRDPSARFAAGGLYSEVSDSGGFQVRDMTGWLQAAMNEYQTRYGAPMPVEIWNFHFYVAPEIRAIDRPLAHVAEFVAWGRTVDEGRYAGAEFWCTEFGVAFWRGGHINRSLIHPWLQRICLALETSDVDRFFWFIGAWPSDPSWQHDALLYADGTRTNLGETYSWLANHYPNADVTPMPDPDFGALPPPLIANDFDDGRLESWIDKEGPWVVRDGALYCDVDVSSPMAGWNYNCVQPYWYDDVTIEADVKMNVPYDAGYWMGFTVHSNSVWFDIREAGWLAYLREDGRLALHSTSTGAVAEATRLVDNPYRYHHLRVDAGGDPTLIEVWVDGERMLRFWEDHSRYRGGFAGLMSLRSNVTYDNVRVHRSPLSAPEAINGDFELGDTSDLSPWLRWRGDASSREVDWLHEMEGATTGRNGSPGLRITVPGLAKVFDAGVKRAVAGGRADMQYAVEAYVRCDRALGPRQQVMVGIDPAGQIENQDAPTIRWSPLPAAASSYIRVQTPWVDGRDGRLGIWFRALNRDQVLMAADVDDIRILSQQAVPPTLDLF